jgi:hypothetical protein
MDLVDGPDDDGDEIAFDPPSLPGDPLFRALPAITARLRREVLVEGKQRPTRRGWLLAVLTAVVVVGALKLAGVIWTSVPPPWVAALGPGVKVTGPGPVSPGRGSPGAALAGALAALAGKDPAQACQYLYGPDASCQASFSHEPRNQLPYSVSAKIGYVAIDGTRALAGFTGEICSPSATPRCVGNANPASIFATGMTFPALWAQTLNPTSGGEYSLQPCVEVGGKWYLGSGPDQDAS